MVFKTWRSEYSLLTFPLWNPPLWMIFLASVFSPGCAELTVHATEWNSVAPSYKFPESPFPEPVPRIKSWPLSALGSTCELTAR